MTIFRLSKQVYECGTVFDRKKAGAPSPRPRGQHKEARRTRGGGCGGRRVKLRGGHFVRSITTNQRRSKDFSAASIRVPHSFYSRLPGNGAATISSSTSTSLSRTRSLSCGRGSAGTTIRVRMLDGRIAALDAWIAKQKEPELSRPEAIRRLVELGLKVSTKRRTFSRCQRRSPLARTLTMRVHGLDLAPGNGSSS